MPSVSVRDVAALAGVSVGTVSNVLNRPDKVADDTVGRVQLAIEKLGFVRNDAARQLRAGHSRAIGLVILDVGNPFFTDLARGAEDKASEAGYSIILGNSDEKAERESAYLDLFEEQRVRGVLISPFGDIEPRLRRLRDRGIRAVLVDRTSPDTSFSSVSVDDVAGGAMAVEHLIETGPAAHRVRRRTVRDPPGRRPARRRAAGRRRARGRLARGRSPCRRSPSSKAGWPGRSIVARPPDERPDALFAANDLIATGLLQALFMRGHRARARRDRAHRLRRHRLRERGRGAVLVHPSAERAHRRDGGAGAARRGGRPRAQAATGRVSARAGRAGEHRSPR